VNYIEQKLNTQNLQPGTKCYKMGVCKILISPPYSNLGWHMSISCNSREPTWNEIKRAWYDLIPDAKNKHGAMFFPPESEYVNIHKNCFHIHEVKENCKEL
jgi:hypothetical protein